ncbi:MAG: aminotransferase class V-fold PLP-dependent enzyme [Clostridia bacterium]|nr:aminotransferase class V-fold PLP-dependent enzyme [Clostridia bacterium]
MEDVFLNGPQPDAGAPHILNLSFTGVRGEVLLNALAAHDIYVSTGSACSSSQKSDNRILNAMNLDRSRRDSAIRFSLSPYTTPEEIDEASDVIRGEVAKLRKYRRR